MTLLLILSLFFLIAVGSFVFLQRLNESRHGLERKIKELNDKLKSTFERFEETKARLETTFAGMAEGVLLADQRGDILHVNPTFRAMFKLKDPLEGQSALGALASVACDDAIQKVIREGQPVQREVLFEHPQRRFFQIHFSPIRRENKLFGVVAVFHDITEIRRLEEVRRDFIANLSHELKTPLTAIRGFSETLLEEKGHLPEASKKQLEVIFRHATELTHLVENLLDLSRIESGKEELALEPVRLKPFIDCLLESFQAQAQLKRLELRNEIPDGGPSLQADPKKLNQILGNLVDNAIKYSSEGGKVWVRAHKNPEGSEIEVEDDGPGISPKDQERIFERFYRVDKARSRDSGGAGLGLAIVKHLAELHGGRVNLESSLGKGARFKVSFPQ